MHRRRFLAALAGLSGLAGTVLIPPLSGRPERSRAPTRLAGVE